MEKDLRDGCMAECQSGVVGPSPRPQNTRAFASLDLPKSQPGLPDEVIFPFQGAPLLPDQQHQWHCFDIIVLLVASINIVRLLPVKLVIVIHNNSG